MKLNLKKPNFKFKKPKLRTVLILCAVVAVGGFAAVKVMGMGKAVALPVNVTPLQKGNLQNTISATGTVESADASYIYTSLTSPVLKVNVSVGDRVSEGDVLCEMDTEDLKLDIARQQASIAKAQAGDAHSIDVSQKQYENAKSNIENDLNSALISAETELKAAKKAADNAQEAYDDAKDDYEDAKDDHTVGDSDSDTLSVKQARRLKDEADRAYSDARMRYENAKRQRDAAINAANQELEGYEDTIEGNKIAADLTAEQLELQKLRRDLEDSVITSPISGTVTAVYAKEGVPGNGLMFVVEDTDALQIKTALKEYDIGTVQEGMSATIRADATGEEEFEGSVRRIYPAAIKAADGTTKTDGTVEFETDVDLTSKDTGLRIGMSVRLNILTASKENVWSVPYDAVTLGASGEDIVYVARPGTGEQAGKTVAEAVPVTTGMETDFDVEIDSEGLKDGDQIISDPSGIMPGMEIMVLPAMGGMAGGMTGAMAEG